MPPDDDPNLEPDQKPWKKIKEQKKPKDEGPKHKYGEDRR